MLRARHQASGAAPRRTVAVDELADHLGGRVARAMLATTLNSDDLSVVRERGHPTTLILDLAEYLFDRREQVGSPHGCRVLAERGDQPVALVALLVDREHQRQRRRS